MSGLPWREVDGNGKPYKRSGLSPWREGSGRAGKVPDWSGEGEFMQLRAQGRRDGEGGCSGLRGDSGRARAAKGEWQQGVNR